MNAFFRKSLHVVTIARVRVHLHVLLLVLAVPLVLLFFSTPPGGRWAVTVVLLPLSVLILFVSVLLHELGHVFGARRVGGEAWDVVLWPLGGLAACRIPENPHAHLVTAVAGPLVSLVLFLTALALALFFDSLALPVTWWTAGIRTVLHNIHLVNGMLFFFNLIPAYPMDGGRILRSVLWERIGYCRAAHMTHKLAWICAGGMVLWAFLAVPPQPGLVLIAVFVVFSAEQEKKLIEMTGYSPDFSVQRHDFFFRHPDVVHAGWQAKEKGWWAQWKENRAARRRCKAARMDQALRENVDRILAKISEEGIGSLTRKERDFLNRASKKYKHHG